MNVMRYFVLLAINSQQVIQQPNTFIVQVSQVYNSREKSNVFERRGRKKEQKNVIFVLLSA